MAALTNSHLTTNGRFAFLIVIILNHIIAEGLSKRQKLNLRSELPEHFSMRMRKFAIVSGVLVASCLFTAKL